MKRKSSRKQSEPRPRKTVRHGGHRHAIPAMHFPWETFFVRFIDNGEANEGCLEIEHAGEVVDELGLSLVQTSVLRMLAAKVLDSGATHRAGTLISTKILIEELSQRYDDPQGERVWDGRSIHDLIYDIREKLRTSRAARWAIKEIGQELDFGMFVLPYDAAYRKYGLNVPKDRLEIVQLS